MKITETVVAKLDASPKVVDNWRDILKHSWNLRIVGGAALLSAVATAIEVGAAVFGALHNNASHIMVGVLTTTAFVSAGVARFIKQDSMTKKDGDGGSDD